MTAAADEVEQREGPVPFGSREDDRKEVEHRVDSVSDSCILFFVPANDILPDTPTENVVGAYTHARNRGR